jgi:hypothetical protein
MPDPEMIEPEDWLPHRDVPRPHGCLGKAVVAVLSVILAVMLAVIFWPLIELVAQWFMA